MKSQKFYERALRKYFDANLLRYAKTMTTLSTPTKTDIYILLLCESAPAWGRSLHL